MMMNSMPIQTKAVAGLQTNRSSCVTGGGQKYCGTTNTYVLQGGKKLNVMFDDKNKKAVFLNGDAKTFDPNNVISYVKDGQQRAIAIEDYKKPAGKDRNGITADGLTLLQYNPKTPNAGSYTQITPDSNNNPVWGESGNYKPGR
jgi:hypothetical protein